MAHNTEHDGQRCACSGTPAHGTGPGAAASGVDQSIKEANLKQLRRIEGQVRGIAAMIESDRYCADVITQVAAARESLRTVGQNLMRNHLKHCAAEAMGRDESERSRMIDELLDLVGRMTRG